MCVLLVTYAIKYLGTFFGKTNYNVGPMKGEKFGDFQELFTK